MSPRFILASSSPRRKELLKLIGIQPLVLIPRVDERRLPDEDLDVFLRRVTLEKGRAVFMPQYLDIPIISADTIVYCDDKLIGKPRSRQDAYSFMQMLADNVHEVWTGLGILYKDKSYYDVSRTRVEFSAISEKELQYYLDNEHYMDKAGAYAIQGMASIFVNRIEGCYFNVMGFPLNLFYNLIKQTGVELWSPLK